MKDYNEQLVYRYTSSYFKTKWYDREVPMWVSYIPPILGLIIIALFFV